MTSRSVVVISPYFPPSTLAGVHRARHLAKHLPTAGWTPIVICVDEAFHEQRLDPGLAALVPETAKIIKVGAIPARLSRPAGLGDISLRAWRPLRAAVLRALASRKVDAVLITGSPFYPMLLAPEIKRRFGTPVILDFQDPWVSAWGAKQPWQSKAGLAHHLALALEPRAVRSADYITSVSDVQNAEMAKRYPWLRADRMAGIPIGGDLGDFAAINHDFLRGNELEAGFINLSYVGSFWPRVAEPLRTVLRAFRRLQAQEPDLASRIRLNFVGTNSNPNDLTSRNVETIAREEGVQKFVREIPQRLPYLRALGVLARSDALLLIGSDEPHYTASKIYPALMSGRPSLALFHRESSAYDILMQAGGSLVFGFTKPQELAGLTHGLMMAIKDLALHPEAVRKVDRSKLAPYEAREIAARFAAVFDSLT